MKLGVIGLPNVGKSTLFNALTRSGAAAQNYPFCTIDPNIGVVNVPDVRLDALAEIYQPKKLTPATVEFVDIAGLVRGASKGEGLGNQFLSHIREVDAIVHVVRCFDDDNVTHVDGKVDPARDVETIELELALADLDTLERRISRTEKMLKTGDKEYPRQLALLKTIYNALSEGKSARSVNVEPEDAAFYRELFLLTGKPVIYCANVSEQDVALPLSEHEYASKLIPIAKAEGAGLLSVCAQVEQELTELSPEDAEMFLNELGLEHSGLVRLIQKSYALLGLISYLTAGPKEVRAWTIEKGLRAPQAAGKIHTDFERGFIRAEVIGYDTFMTFKSMTAAKEKGLVRSEGKEYIVEDGDIVLFRFNV